MKNAANLELVQNFVKHISKLEGRQKRFMNNALKSSGLYGMMYKLIITIKRQPGTNQDYLAELYSIDKSRITRKVAELEKMGYLSRSINESDRRYYRLFLTGDGERLYDAVLQALAEWGTVISKNISAEDISLTVNTIEKMITNAG